MIPGYQRKPTQFDWSDTKVWLRKLTKAEREEVFKGGEALFVDVVVLALVDEAGAQCFKDRESASAYFDKEVGEVDFLDLGKLALKHSGFDLDQVEQQKKS
jgi:hypothetical protein